MPRQCRADAGDLGAGAARRRGPRRSLLCAGIRAHEGLARSTLTGLISLRRSSGNGALFYPGGGTDGRHRSRRLPQRFSWIAGTVILPDLLEAGVRGRKMLSQENRRLVAYVPPPGVFLGLPDVFAADLQPFRQPSVRRIGVPFLQHEQVSNRDRKS